MLIGADVGYDGAAMQAVGLTGRGVWRVAVTTAAVTATIATTIATAIGHAYLILCRLSWHSREL